MAQKWVREIPSVPGLYKWRRHVPVPGHGQLLAALNSRYPETPFRLQQESDCRTWDVGIIDRAGIRVTDNLGKWK